MSGRLLRCLRAYVLGIPLYFSNFLPLAASAGLLPVETCLSVFCAGTE